MEGRNVVGKTCTSNKYRITSRGGLSLFGTLAPLLQNLLRVPESGWRVQKNSIHVTWSLEWSCSRVNAVIYQDILQHFMHSSAARNEMRKYTRLFSHKTVLQQLEAQLQDGREVNLRSQGFKQINLHYSQNWCSQQFCLPGIWIVGVLCTSGGITNLQPVYCTKISQSISFRKW